MISTRLDLKGIVMHFLARLFVLFLVAIVWHVPAFASERIIKLATLNWEPYSSEEMEDYGFTSAIVTKVFEKSGYKVEISFLPWVRVLEGVKSGEYDAMYPAYYSEERARVYALSKPIAEGPLVFCARCDAHIQFTTLKDLEPYSIGLVRGYVNTDELDAAHFLKKQYVNSDKQNLLKVLTGRIDLAVVDRYVAGQIIKTSIPEASEKLCFLKPSLEHKPLYVGFSKSVNDYAQLLNDFNRALEKMIADGSIEKILKKQEL